jgi:hypothetical protein
MDVKKLISFVPLFIGIVCLVAALVGGGMQLLKEGEPQKAEQKKLKAARIKPPKKAVEKAQEPKPAPTPEKQPLSESERKRLMTRVLLDRIEKTPERLDLEWFAGICQHIRDEGLLKGYLEGFLSLGAQRLGAYETEQKRAKKVPSTDPRYFINLARSEIYASKPTKERIESKCRGNLALGLYKEQQEKKGLENIDEEFMASFFKELLAMNKILGRLAREGGEDEEPWLVEQVKILEATAIDRHLRIVQREEMVRRKREGSQQSAAPQLLRTGILKKSLNQMLLQLGQLYLERAERETKDREKLQFYADRAFAILAMVYQRTRSGDSLIGIRKVNDIQRHYLHRLARASWKRAQLSATGENREKTAEQYFQATQRYNECMVKAVGLDKEEIAEEFIKLKQEIAAWHAKQKAEVISEDAGL